MKILKNLLFALIFMCFAFTWFKQGVMINRVKKNTIETQIAYEKVAEENAVLKAMVGNIDTEEFILTNARTRLDIYQPGQIPVRYKTVE